MCPPLLVISYVSAPTGYILCVRPYWLYPMCLPLLVGSYAPTQTVSGLIIIFWKRLKRFYLFFLPQLSFPMQKSR